ncbi:Tax1-binding protein 1 like B [Dissostichus eleginoides]|uniref:Tax1-binding protein 1 like B n=1 Tax=Dissostichus eleginoides TaxID=100907 RepID=A0AAD9BD32_DISEL|nr:Tax1-binding protein 1 like B [Dissostichus eleginoides]
MSSFQVVDSPPGSSISIMETSNFAHVIFQNVGKSFLPQVPLECCYTLTPYIPPHPKDWVGIFKVGWSTARDYYTFLWSPMPENYEPGSTVHRTLVFQGYYVPKSDGEFYQFCYVTHVGDIRGASTPFQFRSATPTEELLTVTEDDSNSDILVVTTKTGLLEHVEDVQQERRELLMTMRLLQEEKQQLQEEQRRLSREREQERDTCCLLRTHNQELLRSSQGLSEEREEVRRRLSEATERVRQLEEDLLGVTQRGLQKETELDCLRDRLKKLTAEKDSLESHLKNEKDERDLYKAHLRSTELENTKLSAELQMLKAVELNREVTIAQFQEELDRLRLCVAQRDSLEKELLAHKTDKADLARVREQLRQAEDQLQASRQQASLLASELRDAASARDHTMTELYRARLEADKLRASLADAQAECQRMESQLDRMRSTAQKEVGVGTSGEMTPSMMVVSEAEAELQREVEELKLRLHMAAEHYKEKYRECQRLRRQVAKLNMTESQGEPKRNVSTETTPEPLTPSPESPTAGNIAMAVLQEAAEMTITPGLNNRESTHAACISTEREDRQREKMPNERPKAEAEGEEIQVKDGEKEDRRKEKRRRRTACQRV